MTFYIVKSSYYKMEINKSSFDLFLKLVLYFNGVFEISFIYLLHAYTINITFVTKKVKSLKMQFQRFSACLIFIHYFFHIKNMNRKENTEEKSLFVYRKYVF